MSPGRRLWVPLLVLGLLAGCATKEYPPAPGAAKALAEMPPGTRPQTLPPSAPSPPTPLPTQLAEYRLTVGDILEVSIARADIREQDDLRRQVIVRPDGRISYFFIGDVPAVGLTVTELRQEVMRLLGAYVRSPESIGVFLVEVGKTRVYVTGEVAEQGTRELRFGQNSVLDAIFASKGLTPKADSDRAYVIRRNGIINVSLQDALFRGNRSANIVLEPEDVVYVPEALEQRVFVVGHVRRPGAFEVSRPIRVSEAIALAEDFTPAGKKDAVKIIRGLPTGSSPPEVLTVDVDQIRDGEAPDVLVNRGDIVLVAPTLLGKWNEILTQLLPSLQSIFIGSVVGGAITK